MTLIDNFAFTPKRCGRCNRKFIFERYYYGYEKLGTNLVSAAFPICKRCKRRRDDNN